MRYKYRGGERNEGKGTLQTLVENFLGSYNREFREPEERHGMGSSHNDLLQGSFTD